MPVIGRAIPRIGVSLALAASLFGVGAGQLIVGAEGLAPTGVDGASLPFIVCGVDTRLESGGSQSILLTSNNVPVSPPQINPDAIGHVFQIHGVNVANCGADNAFQGVADAEANTGPVTLPAGMAWSAGDRAGPTSDAMTALGCKGAATQGCTMVVPVATGVDADGQLQTVVLAVMDVTMTGAGSHSGWLMGDASAVELRAQ